MATSDLKPPTSLGGYVSDEVFFGHLYADFVEHVPALIWPESNQTYAQMRHDPQLTAIMSAYTLPIRRATWQVNGEGCRPEVAQLVAEDLGLHVTGKAKPSAARVRGVSWKEHLRTALRHLVYGHMPFEIGATIDDAGQARLSVLSERAPRTIIEIDVNRDGSLNSFEQFAMLGMTPPKPILAQNAVWYAHDREGAAWQGVSLLRPAYAPWLLKREMQRILGTANRRFGVGVPIARALPGTNPTAAQMTAAASVAEQYRGGETSGAALPPGFMLELIGLAGSAPDTMAFLKWLDQQMSRMCLAGFLDLGETTHGSRALGQSFIDLFMLSIQSIADDIAETITREAAARIVEWNWGSDEPVPTITVSDVSSTHEITAEAIGLLMQSGGLQADPALDAFIRDTWGFPERSTPWVPPQTTVPAPVKDPTAAPAADPGSETDPPVKTETDTSVKAARPVRAAADDQPDDTATPATGENRARTAVEIAAGVDFAAIATQHAAAVAALLLAWPALVAGLIAALASDTANAAASGTLSELTGVEVSPEEVDALAQAIATHMDVVSGQAATGAVAEAAHQGATVVQPRNAGADQNTEIAKIFADLIAGGYTGSATRTALQVSGDAEADIRQAVEDSLTTLAESDKGWIASNAIAAMTAAQAGGRASVMALAAASWVASEILDHGTCANCREIDGQAFGTWEEALATYPQGPMRTCLGAWRCRGQLVAIYTGGE